MLSLYSYKKHLTTGIDNSISINESKQKMKQHAFRLKRGTDLLLAIEEYVNKNNITAGTIVCCVGCLYKAVIRDAGGKDTVTLDMDVEIVSITGTLSPDGCHIHISVSDKDLKTYGGHLMPGCLVNTTAEIVLLELDDYSFKREMDNETGYKELVIEKSQNWI